MNQAILITYAIHWKVLSKSWCAGGYDNSSWSGSKEGIAKESLSISNIGIRYERSISRGSGLGRVKSLSRSRET